MKLQRKSGAVVLVPCIVEFAERMVTADSTTYSFGLEFGLAELVREEMRSMAQKESPHPNAGVLLQEAIDRVARTIAAALTRHEVRLDIGKYLRKVEERLAFPAKEIQELSWELAKSKSDQKLGDEEELESERGIVRELGLREAIQGLLVEPDDETGEIDLNAIREHQEFRVKGEWFPFEVTAGEFVFVIDDDGSIFVSTVNLPNDVRQRAKETIQTLADILYG